MTPLARADRRVRALYEISTLLTRFDGVDGTLPGIITATAHALPLRSAVVIVDRRDGVHAHLWKTKGHDPEGSNGPLDRAREAYAWFGGNAPSEPDAEPTSRRWLAAPSPEEAVAPMLEAHRFLLAPLAVKGGRVFGVLQVESSNGLEEADVWFVHATAGQLAVAIDRQTAAIDAEARMRAQLDFTRALTGSLGEGILATNNDARITFLNPAAEKLLGWTERSVLGTLASDVLRVQDADGSMLDPGECPLVQSLERRGRVLCDDHSFLGRDGVAVPVSYTADPIYSGGELSGAVVVFRDVLAVKRSERTQRLLASASAALGDSLSYAETLSALVRCTVPTFADRCFVDEVEEGRSLRGAETGPTAIAVAGRRPVLVEHLREGPAEPGEGSHSALLRASGVRSLVVVPLTVRGRAFGVLTFGMAESGRRFTDADVALAEQLGHRAATAIDNARLHRATQDAVRDRQDILAIVSHDLRSPLNTIAMAAALVLDRGAVLGPGDRQAVELVGRSAKRMERMTNDLLDVASIEAGHLAVDARPTAVTRILEEALEVTARPALTRDVELVVASAEPSLLVRCDGERILQVLTNLVGNAIKFTPPGGRIEVSVEARDGFVRFAVADNGLGISEGLLPHLFARFRQAEETASKGRGLGLFIAKGIVEAHGGTLDVDTVSARGTTFSFSLSRDGPSLASTGHDREDGVIGSRTKLR